ncbi:hypothetical protein BZA77DRAFT_175976 [Pyronema omphalodes]|nr:hypothetical protein BZA77DRAFT_175976 [Pyronema omphalodes]
MASQRGPRETAFFNIGVQGRKTGVTVADTGKRDEFGMEDMDAFFSPVKTGLTPAPPPKPVPSQLSQFKNANQTHDQSLTEGTMDVEQSSGIDPTTMIANHKAQQVRQLSAPPTDSPAALLKPTSSPTRGSSVGPASTPARRLDFNRPDLAGARSSSVLGSPLRNSVTNGVTKTNGHGKELSSTPLAAPSSARSSSKRSSSVSQQLPLPIEKNPTEEQNSATRVLKKKPAPRKGLMSTKQKMLPTDDETDTTDEIDTVVNKILDEMEGDDVDMVDADEPPRSQQRKGKQNEASAKKPTPVKQVEKKVLKRAAPVPEPEEEEEEDIEEQDLEPVASKKKAPVKKSPVAKKLVSQKAKKVPEPEPEVTEEEEMEDIPEPVKKSTKRKAPEPAPQPAKKIAVKKKAPEPEPEPETEPESEEELEIEDEEDLEPVAKKGKKLAAKKPSPKKPTPKKIAPNKVEPVKKTKGKKVVEPEPEPEEEEFEDVAEEFEEFEEEEEEEPVLPTPKKGKKAAAAKVPTPKKTSAKKSEPIKKAAKGKKFAPAPVEEEEPEPEPLPSQTSKGKGKGKAPAKSKAALEPLPAKRSGRSSKAAVPETTEDIEMEDAPSVPTPIKKPSKAAPATKAAPKGRGKKAAEPIPEPEPEEEEPPKKKSRSSTGAAKAAPPAKATKTAKGKKPAAVPAEVIAEEEAESSSQAAAKGRKKAPAKKAPAKKTLPASETPASPAAPTASRPSQRIIIEAPPVTPAAADDGTRRSRRHRIAPLQYWKGEKIDYVLEAAQDKNGNAIRMPKIAALVRVEEATPIPKPTRARKTTASVEPVGKPLKRKRGTKKRQEEDEEEQDDYSNLGELDDWEKGETGSDDEDAGIKMGWTKVFPPQFNKDDEPIMEERQLAYTKDRMQTSDIANGAFRFVKTVTQDTFGTGIMEVPPGGGKRTKSSGKMTLVFYMLAGRVTVTIADEKFRVRKGGQFMVPRGNLYSIENDFNVEARMFFAQGRDLPTEEVVEAGQDEADEADEADEGDETDEAD